MSDMMLIRTPDEDDWTYLRFYKNGRLAVIDGGVDVVAQLDDEPLYRKAGDCGIGYAHRIGEHGKPCQECGAEQIWVFPVEREVKG